VTPPPQNPVDYFDNRYVKLTSGPGFARAIANVITELRLEQIEPDALIVGGGIMVQTGGSLVGAIGVSGGPGGDADDACANAGISAIQNKIDF
jgi:uncharacterized protein GlcG (DUF336 family)